MLIITMLSLQYKNKLLPTTSSTECQDGKQKISLIKAWSLCFEQIWTQNYSKLNDNVQSQAVL